MSRIRLHIKDYKLQFFTLITVSLLITIGAAAWGQGRASVTVSPLSEAPPPSNVVILIDGKLVKAESAQMIRSQQIMVWLRDLETLGWGKSEPGEAGQVLFKAEGVTLSFTKGVGVAKVNSLAVKLPVDTYVRDNKLMVPLSFVAKALGYDCQVENRPVAMITTKASEETPSHPNSLEGKVIFAGKGVAGIIVRAVDEDCKVINNAVATTASDGSYKIDNLPNGKYAAYVWTGDNPEYFNRTSDTVTLKDGAAVQLQPIILGEILSPKRPKAGDKARAVDGWITIEWTPCNGAVSYEVALRQVESDTEVANVTCKEAKTRVSASKLKSGTTYEVEVSALDANGNFAGGTAGAGAKPWSFTFVADQSKK